jgi:formimidoylglutamate deiminase
MASAADSTGFAAGTHRAGCGRADPGRRHPDGDVVDRWLFSGNRPLVEDGRHRDRDAIATRYRDAMKALLHAD